MDKNPIKEIIQNQPTEPVAEDVLSENEPVIEGTDQEEKTVSMYDPTVNAYRPVKISLAKKFLEEAELLAEKIKEIEEEK